MLDDMYVEYFRNLANGAFEFLMGNYDYLYLRAMHELIRAEGADTIIVGSSHTMNGIDERYFDDRTINFSVSSQDLFFSFEHIKAAIANSKTKIKKCIINLGYYTMYWDIAKSTSEQYRVQQVYEPLFNYINKGESFQERDCKISSISPSFNKKLMQEIYTDYALEFFKLNMTYYCIGRTRVNNNILGLNDIEWKSLGEQEKEYYAKDRATKHNRHEKRTDTLQDNIKILSEMVKLLNENNIRTIFLICPYTKWYNTYISASYKDTIVKLLDELPYSVELVDLNDVDGLVDDSDFVDSDHLIDSGAVTVSRFINDYLKQF